MGPRGDVVDKGQPPAQAVRLPVAQQNKPDKCGGRQRHPKTKPGSAACWRRLARCPSHCPRACCWYCGDMGIMLAFSLYMTQIRSEEHTSELQSLMRNSYAVFCLKKKK